MPCIERSCAIVVDNPGVLLFVKNVLKILIVELNVALPLKTISPSTRISPETVTVPVATRFPIVDA